MPELINSITLLNTTYQNRSDILDVDLVYTPWQNNDMSSAFVNCFNLTDVMHINNNITNMFQSFKFCTNLINAPTIPNSVSDLSWAFSYCNSLVNAPIIPNSVSNMSGAFSFCVNLVNTPVIPENVNNIERIFKGCFSLVNAPTIPNSVTNVDGMFDSCSNLTGEISIESENVTSAIMCFWNTSLDKDVYIPFKNNGEYTQTYNAFINAGYTTDPTNRVNGVLLIDVNYNPLADYEYTKNESNDVLLTRYIGTELHVVVPTVE